MFRRTPLTGLIGIHLRGYGFGAVQASTGARYSRKFNVVNIKNTNE
jgi:hypothetical protein